MSRKTRGPLWWGTAPHVLIFRWICCFHGVTILLLNSLILVGSDVNKQTPHMKQLTTTLHRSATSVTSYEFHYINVIFQLKKALSALDPDVVWQPKWMTICLEAWGQMELRKYLLTEKIISMLWSMDIMHDYLYIIWYMDFVFKVQYCSRSRSYESQRIIHTHDTLYDCIIV